MPKPTLLILDDDAAAALHAVVVSALDALRAQRNQLPAAVHARRMGLLMRADVTLRRARPGVRADDLSELRAVVTALVGDGAPI